MSPSIFDPWTAGDLRLSNRVVMAPMTRNRAADDGLPLPSMVEYYRQRAGAGLIVTEGTQPSVVGKCVPRMPGIHTDAQVDAWAKVTDAVHAEGGTIVCQIMHCGRMSHPATIGGATPVAPSAVRPSGVLDTPDGEQELVTPHALTTDEIAGIVTEFADASARAIDAGFDGVELHGANGYLIHQFLAENTNLRTDEYGGSPENRARFAAEVARACADRIGAGRVGFRISPAGRFNDIAESDPRAIYTALLEAIGGLGLAYLHTVRRRSIDLTDVVKAHWRGTVVLNTGYGHTSELADVAPLIESGQADLVSVGRLFISNPDLIARWREGHPRADWDEPTFFTAGDTGYLDYPSKGSTS